MIEIMVPGLSVLQKAGKCRRDNKNLERKNASEFYKGWLDD